MQTITGAVAGEGNRRAQTIRGRLKIFLGAAPGAGKTYAMLAEAHAIRAAGGDVVIGIFARQQRGENDVLASGFETLPRSVVGYMGVLETIPDGFFRAADEIVFINCPREMLLERSALGKSHVRGRPPRDMDRFLDTLALTKFGELAARCAREYAS
jgi:K+-sensing histidine kinase KdpD